MEDEKKKMLNCFTYSIFINLINLDKKKISWADCIKDWFKSQFLIFAVNSFENDWDVSVS
jgi:hypothetical protein